MAYGAHHNYITVKRGIYAGAPGSETAVLTVSSETSPASGMVLSLGNFKLKAPASGAASSSGVLMGVGTLASPAATSTENSRFVEIYAKSTATSGDNRLAYFRYDLDGAGSSGDCLRAFTDLGAAVATARGAHISVQVSSTGYVTGLAAGVDAQLYVQNSAVSSGTNTALNVEVYTAGTSSDIPSGTSFIRISNNGAAQSAVDAKAVLFSLDGFTSGGMWTDSTQSAPASVNEWIKVVTPSGTRYLALYDSIPS